MKDEKRARILEAATRIFAEKGYQYATISDIAAEAGIATGLLYSYFCNKLDVLLSIILMFWEEMNRRNLESFASAAGPVDRLLALVDTFEDMLIRDEKSLYLVKVLNEGLPHILLIKDRKLQLKRHNIMLENRRLVNEVDMIMAEGQQQGVIDDSLRPGVMRQVLCGTIERVLYGLSFRTCFESEEIGYEADDAHRALLRLIETFIRA